MDAEERREKIRDILNKADQPVSASMLAGRFGVSRQIVVGDIALLRASGADISATPRGYVIYHKSSGLMKRIACRHATGDMKKELYAIVDEGCTVLDVVVEHPVYGQLTGSLQIASRYDVDQFIRRCEQNDAPPLSLLTDGIHLHTLLCPDESAYGRVVSVLSGLGFLLSEE